MSRIEPDTEKVFEELLEKNLGDGYPIIPPTAERVKRMLEFTDLKPDDVIGKVPPSEDEATVELIAVNAVMAGCKPEYFPIVLTGVKSMLQGRNLRGDMAGDGPHPVVFVNGPMAKEIGLNTSHAYLGPGPQNRANITIGRTMLLCLTNIGGTIPGTTTKRHSSYGVCIAENEELSPWEPLHVEKGFDRETSTVTFGNVGPPTGRGGPGRDHMSNRGEWNAEATKANIMLIAKGMGGHTPHMLQAGNVSFLLVGSSFARWWNEFGWNKKDVKEFIFQNARYAPKAEWFTQYPPELKERGIKIVLAETPKWWAELADVGMPAFESPDSIWIIVVGPLDWHMGVSMARAGHGDSPAIMTPVTFADGTPAKSVYDFKHR